MHRDTSLDYFHTSPLVQPQGWVDIKGPRTLRSKTPLMDLTLRLKIRLRLEDRFLILGSIFLSGDCQDLAGK